MKSANDGGATRRFTALALTVVLTLSGLLSAASAQTTNSRPRTVNQEQDSPNGPKVRVALMTDVAAVTLSCASGLMIREPQSDRVNDETPPKQLRVEVKRELTPSSSKRHSAYEVLVATFDDQPRARRLTTELKDRYREPATVIDVKKSSSFEVVLGRFESEDDAEDLRKILRKAGYKSADVRKTQELSSSAAAREGQVKTASQRSAPSDKSSQSHDLQLVAADSGRVIASSTNRLIIVVTDPESGSGPKSSTNKKSASESKHQDKYDFARDSQKSRDATRDASNDEVESAVRPAPSFIKVDGKPYRGDISLVLNKRGRINVINIVEMEEYLKAVVPMELSPTGFPQIEALKAQAVAARSYALFHRGEHEEEGYDLRDDARSQVYGGVSAEHEASDRAVRETSGVVATALTEEGKWVPIDAMYTANCGGHTENNEDVFGTKPRSYLRAVACDVDPYILTGRELITDRKIVAVADAEGRPLARELALLEVLGFGLPKQFYARYLNAPVEEAEVKAWLDQSARICGLPLSTVSSANTLAGFADLLVSSVYGEGRATVLITPADASYILGGLEARDDSKAGSKRMTSQARSSVALLLKSGILRLPAGGTVDLNGPVSRGLAIETLGRALISRLRDQSLLSSSPQKLETSMVGRNVIGLTAEVATGIDAGRLIVRSNKSTGEGLVASGQPRGYKVENTAARIGKSNEKGADVEVAREPVQTLPAKVEIPRNVDSAIRQPQGLELARDAYLFRNLAGEVYEVTRVTLIGGERVIYHTNSRGQIDFLETTPSDQSAATDRFSRVASWQERITVDELTSRLSRVRSTIGRPQSIAPVAQSSSGRVTELEITGAAGRIRLKGSQIRNVLGLRENMFVVDPETDSRGNTAAFVFTGRGWGHGVGMCQTGAYGLAREGYSFKQILERYYTGVRVQKTY